ncbi:hypothetical protein [Streptomyces sp. NPDC002785]|uniref:hypothetical protein n=1 Tax=Streptomyces sp. NPDC002785 TaxID=3154543 RepID=UPI00333465FD
MIAEASDDPDASAPQPRTRQDPAPVQRGPGRKSGRPGNTSAPPGVVSASAAPRRNSPKLAVNTA